MVRTKEEILEHIKSKIGDSVDDKDLAMLEDISDTIDDLNSRVNEAGDWKTKYEENDKMWRNKYQQTFFNPPSKEDKKDEPENDLTKPEQLTDEDGEKDEPLHFEDLFSEGTGKE